LPVDAVKTSIPGNSGLDFLTFGNISTTNQVRYAAHLILVYIFTCEFYQLAVLCPCISILIFSLDLL
jgi:hypothetical protein